MRWRGAAALVLATMSVAEMTGVGRTFGTAQLRDMQLCVDADGTLRAPADIGASCPEGRRTASVVSIDPVPTPPTAIPPPHGPVRDPLRALEQRMAALETTAVFGVMVNGRWVMSVAPGATHFYGAEGEALATVRSAEDGAFFMGRSPGYRITAAIGAVGRAAGLRVREGGALRVDLGRQEAGNAALRFLTGTGNLVAGIGESRTGTGVLRIGDHRGLARAWMTASDDVGAVSVLNGQTSIASLGEGATHGGLLTIFDGAGTPMVKMGVADGRYGMVLTGPAAGLPLIPATGLPGSYIMGNAGK